MDAGEEWAFSGLRGVGRRVKQVFVHQNIPLGKSVNIC